MTAQEYETDLRQGACAEVCGIQLNAEGQALQTALRRRIIGFNTDQLRAVPEIIGIAYGSGKAEAVRAAVRAGFATSLITHESLAYRLLGA